METLINFFITNQVVISFIIICWAALLVIVLCLLNNVSTDNGCYLESKEYRTNGRNLRWIKLRKECFGRRKPKTFNSIYND